MAPKSERFLIHLRIIVFAFLILVIAHSSWKMISSPLAKGDIETYRYAAHQMVVGENIYTTTSRPHEEGGSYYLYPPLFALLFIPFSFLPIDVAIVLWCLVNVLLVGWAIKAFYEVMTGASFSALPSETRWIIVGVPTLLTLRFLLYHLNYGQTNILVTAIAILGLRLIKSKRGNDYAGGGILGLSIVIKIVTLPLALWFLLQGRMRVLAGMVMGAIAGLLLPALFLGWDRNWSYLGLWFERIVLYKDLSTFPLSFSMNVSLQALVHRLLRYVPAFEHNRQQFYFTIFEAPPKLIHLAGWLISLAVIGAIIFYRLRYRTYAEIISQWGGVALTFTLIPIFTPSSQQHYFVFLLPSYIYVVYLWHCLRMKDRWFRGLVVASFVIASLTTDGIWGRFLGHVFVAAGCIVWGTLLLAAAIFRAAMCFGPSPKAPDSIR